MNYFLDEWAGDSEEYKRLLIEEKLILEVTERIWEILEKRDMTKADLAKKLDKSKAFVSQLLSGSRNMTLRTLADIAFALDLNPSVDLLEKNESREWLSIGTVDSGLATASNVFFVTADEKTAWTKTEVITSKRKIVRHAA